MFFQFDLGIKQFFSSECGLPVADCIISSNAWAMKNRIKQKGSLAFPFLNYRILPGQPTLPDRTFPRNYYMTNIGIWESDLKDRVKCEPFFAKYEATFWSVGFVNTVSVFQRFYEQNFQDDLINYSYIIRKADNSEVTFQLKAPFEFTSLELDPQWNESEELEKGKIHAVDLSFAISGYIMKGAGVVPINEVIVEAFYNNEPYEDTTIPDNASLDQTTTLTVP